MTTDTTKPLTPRMLELVDVIRDHIARHGYPPTQAEAARRMGIDPRRCARLAAGIVERGYLSWRPGVPRSWVPIEPDAKPTPRRRPAKG